MAFWNKKREERADESQVVESSGNISLEALLSNAEMTKQCALQIPSVAAAINKIASTVAKLPVKLYQKDENGKVTEIKDDRRTFLLSVDPGDTLNIVNLWESVIEDYYVGDGGWIYIDRDFDYSVRSLRYVDSSRVSVSTNNQAIFKDYDVFIDGVKYNPFDFVKILRNTKDGCQSKSIVEENSKILSVAYNSLKYENSTVKKGGNKRGFFKAKNKLSEAAMKDLRQAINTLYSADGDSAERAVILNDGMDFKESSATALELQLNENKITNADEIFKIFGFPASIVKGGANENDRQLFIECVVGLLNSIEAALDKDLLLESEKENRFFAFDTRDITRGNMKERFDAYAVAVDKHIMQVDEIREREDLPPMGFNYINLGLADVLYNPQTKEIFVPNTGKAQRLDGKIGVKGGDDE